MLLAGTYSLEKIDPHPCIQGVKTTKCSFCRSHQTPCIYYVFYVLISSGYYDIKMIYFDINGTMIFIYGDADGGGDHTAMCQVFFMIKPPN